MIRRALIWVLAVLPLATPAASWELNGRVVAVHDGDTLTILDDQRQQHRVRLSGVDAPERGQPFGTVTRNALVKMAKGKQAAAHCHTKDRYRREVCIVTIRGVDAGQRQIERGLAWVFTRYASELPPGAQAEYKAGEDAARAARAGLWADEAPVAPWLWRRRALRTKVP